MNPSPTRKAKPAGVGVAILLSLLGLALALTLLPGDVTGNGVLMPSAFAMCLTILAYPICRIAFGGVRELLHCDVIVLVGFAYLTFGDVVQPNFSFPLDKPVLIECYSRSEEH